MNSIKEDPAQNLHRAARGFRFFPLVKHVLIQKLKEMGVDFVCVESDVNAYVADYAISNNALVMGYDSHYLGFDIEFCYIESIQFEDEPYQSKTGKQVEPRDDVTIMKSSAKLISQYLELTMQQFQYLLRFLPNDHLNAWNELRVAHQVAKDSRDQYDSMIVALAKIVKDNWTEDEAAMNALMWTHQQAAHEQLLALKNAQKQELDDKIAAYEKQLLELAAGAQNDHTVKKTEETKKSIQILVDQKTTIGSAEPLNKDECMKQLGATKQMFATKPVEQALQNFEKLPKWVNGFFKFGKLPAWLYQALKGNCAQFQPFFEDVAAVASAKHSAKLRSILYGFMGLKEVSEYTRKDGKQLVEKVQATKPAIELTASVKLSVAERQKLVLDLITGDKAKAEKLMQYEDQHTKLVAAALVVFINEFKPSQQILAALTTAIFHPIKEQIVVKYLTSNTIERNVECCTAISAFQNILDACLSINNLFGMPLLVRAAELINAPSILVQFKQETENQSPMRKFIDVFINMNVPEDFELYTQKKKTSERLSMQAMQIAEKLDNVKIVNTLFTICDQCKKMENYDDFEVIDTTAEEFEEKQKKKAVAGDFKLSRGNKFAMLNEE